MNKPHRIAKRMYAAIRTVLAEYDQIADEDQSVLYCELPGWMRYLRSAVDDPPDAWNSNTASGRK